MASSPLIQTARSRFRATDSTNPANAVEPLRRADGYRVGDSDDIGWRARDFLEELPVCWRERVAEFDAVRFSDERRESQQH